MQSVIQVSSFNTHDCEHPVFSWKSSSLKGRIEVYLSTYSSRLLAIIGCSHPLKYLDTYMYLDLVHFDDYDL